jgi:malate dehydrogenase (oxaloacetate-decarboxylating)
VVFGSGSAGTGIADQFARAIASECGKSQEEATKHIWFVPELILETRGVLSLTHTDRCLDRPGLLLKSYGDNLTPAQAPFARDDSEWPDRRHLDLLSVIKRVKPHVLVGTSTRPGSFTETIIKEMGTHVERPIVFPLSNPTRLHEARPSDLMNWTEGRALIATGSPFPAVKYNGIEHRIGE